MPDPTGRRQMGVTDLRGDDLKDAKLCAQGVQLPGPKGATRTVPWAAIHFFDTVDE